jgi:hypothetical protein
LKWQIVPTGTKQPMTKSSDQTLHQHFPCMFLSEQPISSQISTIELVTGIINLEMQDHINLYYRTNCFDATLIHLTERFNGKDVYLIGTANQSTMLGQRTKKLIESI